MKQPNPYGLTEEEVAKLEAGADIYAELMEKRLSKLPESDKEGYTWEQVKQPKFVAFGNVSTDE